MQIRSVMTSYCLELKSGKYLINDISRNIEAVILKLGTVNVHQKNKNKTKQKNKMTILVLLPWQQFCRWCWVNKNRNSWFCFKTRTIYPTQSNDGTKDNMGTISVRSRTLCPTVEVANGDFFVFWQKETGAKRVDISKTKKDISKRKATFFCMLKDLQISTIIFHFIGTLKDINNNPPSSPNTTRTHLGRFLRTC